MINGVKRLKRYTRAPVKRFKRDNIVYRFNRRFRSAVAISVNGFNRPAVLNEGIVHAPTVYRKAVDFAVFIKGFFKPRDNLAENSVYIPNEAVVFLFNAV